MFERFTDRARKVIALASQEAQRLNHEYLGTEHILLGLVKEGSGVGATVLKQLDVELPKVRMEVEKLVKVGPGLVKYIGGKPLPQTPEVKQFIEYAIKEAQNLGHNYIGTEHLLLGLLRDPDNIACKVLAGLGLDVQKIRAETLELLGPSPMPEPITSHQPIPPPGVRSFDDRVRKTMALANQEAQRMNHKYISPEHILLGLVKEGSGVAATVIKDFGVEFYKLRQEVERQITPGPDWVAAGKLPQTPQATKVIEYAIEACHSLNHQYIGTEHILLGLLRDPDQLVAKILLSFGVDYGKAWHKIQQILNRPHTEQT